jgi:hypothetical protein
MKIAATIAALLMSQAVQASFVSGNDLLSDMRASETFRRLYAIGYIAGVADTSQHITHCPPDNVTLGQVKDMVEMYLIANAAERNKAADILIVRMLADQ